MGKPYKEGRRPIATWVTLDQYSFIKKRVERNKWTIATYIRELIARDQKALRRKR